MRDKLIELISQKQACGAVYERSQMDERKIKTVDVYNSALADHLLENGIIVPPCKVGDKIYGLFESNRLDGKTRVIEYIVDELLFSTKRGVRPWVICCYGGRRFDNYDFGKTVFLTREAAEQALTGGAE